MDITASPSIFLPALDSMEVLQLTYKIARSMHTKHFTYAGNNVSILEVDDLAQIIRLQLWLKQGEYNAIPGIAWEAWVWRVGMNACINAYTKDGRKNQAISLEALEAVLSDSVATLGGIDRVEANQIIQELVALLTPLEITVLYLKLCGRSAKEIASILTADKGVSMKTMDTDKRYLAGQVKAFYNQGYEVSRYWGVVTERQVYAAWDRTKRKAKIFAVKHNLTSWLAYIGGSDGTTKPGRQGKRIS